MLEHARYANTDRLSSLLLSISMMEEGIERTGKE